jgi:hypothetical protein
MTINYASEFVCTENTQLKRQQFTSASFRHANAAVVTRSNNLQWAFAIMVLVEPNQRI